MNRLKKTLANLVLGASLVASPALVQVPTPSYAAQQATADCENQESEQERVYCYAAEAFQNCGKGNYAQAISDADKALRRNPTATMAVLVKGKAYQQMSCTNLERDVYDTYLKISGGQMIKEQFDPDDAWDTHLAETLTNNQDLAEIFYSRGICGIKLGEGGAAISYLIDALRVDGVLHQTNNHEGSVEFIRCVDKYLDRDYLAYLKGKEFAKAVVVASAMISYDSKKPGAFNWRGYAYGKLGKKQEALADYNRAIELAPRFENVLENRASLYYELKRPEEFLADINRVIEINPKNKKAFYMRGTHYYELNEFQKAVAEYDKTLELDSKHGSALINRGVCYRRLGRLQESIVDFTSAIELDPKSTSALSKRGYSLAFGNRGESNVKLGNLQQALKDVNKAIDFDPNHTFPFITRGECYAAMGKLQEAIQDFDKALEIDPKDEDAIKLKEQTNEKLRKKQR